MLAGTCLTLAAATPAAAEQTCPLGGQAYPANVIVCSGGLVATCINGNWQSNNGQRCDAPSGTYLGPRRPFEPKNQEEIPEYYRDKYPGLERN